MKNIVTSYVRKFRAERRKSRRATALLLALALLVSTGVTWQLHATGIALTNETYCGLEEHTHTEDCYEQVLVCSQEESEGHTHTEDCYEEQQVLVCGQEESEGHTHTDDCYETQLTCGKEEHTHTVDCLTDETADVETAADWEATLPDLTGEWGTDVAAIAKSQLGYTESTANFTLADDGETRKGYTRYGAWYGNEYGDWDAMFASFCLYYAGVDEDAFPQASGVYAWVTALDALDLYDEDAEPTNGDLVFFDTDKDGKADHVGVVAGVSDYKVTVIEGDSDDKVQSTAYSLNDSTITGYGVLPEQEEVTEAEETETYTAADGGVTVTVTAPVGALPEGAELSVTLFDESSEEYAAAGETVDYDTEDATTGMAAMDISFTVDGVEVEPTEAVTVSIDASALLPEDADAETIEVQHLTETEAGVEATLVADATEDTAGTVDAETVTAKFEVESFSTFTIQWNSYGTSSSSVSTTCYFSNGSTYETNSDLTPSGITDNKLVVGDSNEVDFDDSNSLLAVEGYTLVKATLTTSNITNSVTIASIRAQKSGSSYTYSYATAASDGTLSWTTFSGSNMKLSLYYDKTVEEATGDLTIRDDIASTGSLVAEYSGTLTEGSYSYQWYEYDTTKEQFVLIQGENEASLAVYSNGARKTYQVKLIRVSDNTEIATSTSYQVPYYSQLQNGSFENPTVSSSSDSIQVTSGLYEEMVWLTTGFGSLNESKGTSGQDIEIVKASGGSGWHETTAKDGNQYAELNAEYNGTLYQDVMTIPGVPLYWQAYHEARTNSDSDKTGLDTMCVIIVDAAFAEAHLTTQAQIEAVYEAAKTAGLNTSLTDGESSSVTFDYTVGGETKSITLWLCASNGWNETTNSTNDAWNEFKGTYTVPEGQYLTRFLFGAISTCSGDNTIGNLLDNVSFSQTAPTSEKSGNIKVTKTVSGVDSDVKIAKGTYTFTVQDTSGSTVGTVSLPTADATASQSEYWSYTFTDITPSTYKVTESDGASPDGYNYDSTTSSTGTDTTNTTTSANFVVSNSKTSSVAFTNTYQKATTSITLKKVDATPDESGSYTPLSGAVFTLSATGESDCTLTVANGTLTVENITYGTEYTLTETKAPDGYDLLSAPVKFTVKTDGTVTFSSGGDAAFYTTENDTITITVKNKAGYALPETGGSGAWLYTLMGLTLCGGAALLLLKRRVGQ